MGSVTIDVDGLATFLCRCHRRDTAWEVEQRTGIPAGTVRNWLQRRCCPSLEHALRLACAYGPKLLAACWPDAPEWIKAAVSSHEATTLKREIAERQAMLDRLETR